MAGDKIRVHLPWDAPILKAFNGDHPLPSSLIAGYERIGLERSVAPVTADAQLSAKQAAQGLEDHLASAVRDQPETRRERFVASRDAEDSQAMMRGDQDLLFLHTAPLTYAERPFILHVEELLTLFAPFTWHGQSANVNVREEGYFPFIKALLEHPNCRAVFSHLRHSAEWAGTLFNSEIIAGKSHFVPIGIGFDPDRQARLDQAFAAKTSGRDPGRPVTFLFTNSWAQAEGNFVLRGGMEVVTAFAELVKTHPNCRLILRSALPVSYFGEGFAEFVKAVPQIQHLADPIEDDALFGLLAEADAFLLPSCGLHTVSLLRAMASGAVLVTSDAPGVENFVTDDVTGLVVPGRLGKTAWYDEIGFLHQTFEPMFAGLDPAFVGGVYGAMRRLVEDPVSRTRLANAGRDHVAKAHALGPWRQGFEDLVVASAAR